METLSVFYGQREIPPLTLKSGDSQVLDSQNSFTDQSISEVYIWKINLLTNLKKQLFWIEISRQK